MKLITGTEVKTKVGGGIYYVECLINKKRYIGSSVNIYNRWAAYTRGEIANKSLLKDMVTYGKDNFEMGILESIEVGDLSKEDYSKLLFERESFFIKLLGVLNDAKGYNKTDNTTNSVRITTAKFVYCKNLITKEITVYDSISSCGQHIFEYAKKEGKETTLKICKDRVSEIANQSRGYKNIYCFKDHTYAFTIEELERLEDLAINGKVRNAIMIVELNKTFINVVKCAEYVSTIIGKHTDASNIRNQIKKGKAAYGYTYKYL